ncbi:MAG: DUF2164 domain-containing protein [Myxococcota bacterium]|nr:DUF2164 domain-containing protein [Myxococcota bacterium]
MRIKLSQERRDLLVNELRRIVSGEFDRELSDFQGRRIVDFFVRHLGAPVYNQAIQDARAALQAKLDDLEGEFYEPEPDASPPGPRETG